MQFSRVITPVEDIQVWNATSDGFSFVISFASRSGPGFRMERPEQKKTAHDLSDVFTPSNAVPSSEALTNQQDHGQMLGPLS